MLFRLLSLGKLSLQCFITVSTSKSGAVPGGFTEALQLFQSSTRGDSRVSGHPVTYSQMLHWFNKCPLIQRMRWRDHVFLSHTLSHTHKHVFQFKSYTFNLIKNVKDRFSQCYSITWCWRGKKKKWTQLHDGVAQGQNRVPTCSTCLGFIFKRKQRLQPFTDWITIFTRWHEAYEESSLCWHTESTAADCSTNRWDCPGIGEIRTCHSEVSKKSLEFWMTDSRLANN